jgi:caffeoyl-CoA O-methyltransferase
MSEIKSLGVSAELHRYLVDHGTPPDALQRELIDETQRLGGVSIMQVAPEQGAFLTLFARVIGARKAIEVGTFTGYSSLCIARGLAPGGKLITCDTSEEWTAVARRYWEKACIADKIDLRIGPGADTLRALPADPSFDLGFIDADKGGYPVYYEEILKRLRPNGVILVDNVLWTGRVVDASVQDDMTKAIRAFNDKVAADPRVECVMVPISDGLTLLRKK